MLAFGVYILHRVTAYSRHTMLGLCEVRLRAGIQKHAMYMPQMPRLNSMTHYGLHRPTVSEQAIKFSISHYLDYS